MSYRIQQVIHALEVGAGAKIIKFSAALVALITLAVVYDVVAFKNLSTAEGMDTAQLAQRIADGKGFTTGFIRPFSLYLLRRHSLESDEKPGSAAHKQKAAAFIASHPDLANAPAYPLALAVALKLNPYGRSDTTKEKGFTIYKPELWLAGFNQLLLVIGACLVFRLARKLFDEPVAWVAGIVFAGSEMLWRSSTAGTPAAFLAVIFLLLFSVMFSLQGRLEDPGWRAAGAGALLGAAALTRYSYAWLLVPFIVWMASLPVPRKGVFLTMAVGAFGVVWLPWLARNVIVCGTPFGTAGYALYDGTPFFPEGQLERSFNPDFSTTFTGFFWDKLISNLRGTLEKIPQLGGNWGSAFFLASVMVVFRNVALRRLRLFLLGCLAVLLVVQGLGKTWLSTDAPEIGSENLLLPLVPILFIYGSGFLWILVNQMGLPNAASRLAVAGGFCVIVSAPLWLVLLPPHGSPLAYPPYYPPWIQEKAAYTGEGEIMMTDIPWACAWYGGGTRVWLPLKHKRAEGSALNEDFYEIHNRPNPVRALYLTSKTIKQVEMRALFDFQRNEELEEGWDHFILSIFIKKEVPTGFPLKRAPEGLVPEIFLTDSEREVQK